MSTVGLITEYNPFHMGHQYHIKKAKELTGADTAVVIMSGNYVQRGTPAFMDKHTRTLIALKHGADIVLELPVPFSCSSAEFFALAAVTLLNKTGIIDYICFGCENDALESPDYIVQILAEVKTIPSHKVNYLIKEYVKNGESYASARSLAIFQYISTDAHSKNISGLSVDTILTHPNNILAIEYLKALKLTNSKIKPVTLKRTVSTYHDDLDNDCMYSASSLRNAIHGNTTDLYSERLYSFDNIYRDTLNKLYPVSENDFSHITGERLTYCKVNTIPLTTFFGVDEALENRIYKAMEKDHYYNFTSFSEALKTKNIAYTAISRALLAITLGIRKDSVNRYLENDIASYIRILGFNKNSSRFLNSIKKFGKLTLIGQLSETKDNKSFNDTDRLLLNQSLYCDELYNMIIRNKYNYNIPGEFERKLTVI